MAPTVDPSFVGPQVPASVRFGNFAEKILSPGNLRAVISGVQAGVALKRGSQAEDLAAERAAIDRANAAAVREQSIERATILAERGERLKQRQTSQFISAGIRTNVGVPLLLAAETQADITKDIGFSLDVGRVQEGRFLASADIEERIGRAGRKKARFETIGILAERGLSFLS